MGGSFGRIQSSAQWGKQISTISPSTVRLKACTTTDFAGFQTSSVCRFDGDVGVKNY